ncbi:MAG TPA: hypothetical protein VE465_02020 [Streptosporangiaceae bacterium]|jgi:hypothetical protein|nr:hypothetical protein [Streptosporangiaceae bacterium]
MAEYLNTDWLGSDLLVDRSVRLPLVTAYTTFRFDRDISDSAGMHDADGPDDASIGNGQARFFTGMLDYQLLGGAMSGEVHIRTVEVDGGGNIVETHKPHEFYLASTPPPTDPDTGEYLYPKSTHQRYPIFSNINSGHRLRVQVTHWTQDGPDLYIGQAQLVGRFET